MSRFFGPAFQAAYLARDLTRELHFWTDSVGAGPFFVLPPRTFKWIAYRGERLATHDIISEVALGYLGDTQIEVIVPGAAPSVYLEFRERGETSLHHHGFGATDYDQKCAAARDAGLVLAMEGASALTRFSYWQRDDGQGPFIELIEMSPTVDSVFNRIKAASIGWTGADPIRDL